MKRKVEIIKPAAGSRATGQNIEARLISAATSKQIRRKKDPPCNKLLLCGWNVKDCPLLLLCSDHIGDCPHLLFSDASQTRKPRKQT
jgi:hypothetical protein